MDKKCEGCFILGKAQQELGRQGGSSLAKKKSEIVIPGMHVQHEGIMAQKIGEKTDRISFQNHLLVQLIKNSAVTGLWDKPH